MDIIKQHGFHSLSAFNSPIKGKVNEQSFCMMGEPDYTEKGEKYWQELKEQVRAEDLKKDIEMRKRLEMGLDLNGEGKLSIVDIMTMTPA